MIEFKSEKMSSTMLDPRNKFEESSVDPEIRYDPLTKDSIRLGHFGMIKPQKIDLNKLDNEEVKKRCPFCPDNIEKMTPRYPVDILSEGYLKKGEAKLVPNIAPYDLFSALTVVNNKHLLTLEDISFDILKNAFEIGFEFYQILLDKKPEASYQFLGWNYMPPSGGGLVHAHQQVIASKEPGNYHRKMLEESENYFQKHKTNFWDDLCEKEKEINERFVHEGENLTWLTSYAPLGVLGEYIAVFNGKSTVKDIDNETLEEFVNGLLSLFNYFEENDICSFNLGLYFAPSGSENNGFNIHARIIPRTFLNLSDCPPDANVLQLLMKDPFSVYYPEDICEKVKPYFKRK